MAVSPLIMVRFSKFKIWHAQHFDPDLLDIINLVIVKWRMALGLDVGGLWHSVAQYVARGYLWNHQVDFVHFLQLR